VRIDATSLIRPAAPAAFSRREKERSKGGAMDLRFTPEEIAFRDEVRAFVKASLPESIRRKTVEGRHPGRDDIIAWTRILHAKGWSVAHWPKEWGGTGWSPVQLLIFNDELQQAGAPESLAFGTSMVGPVIYTFGSDAQKRRFLPRIAHLDDWWCQGFSEPGAGSDLAGLKTTARRDGGEWVINGQKTWTTLAQYADWIFVLARTDASVKKQEGISFILVDMKSPGVTVRPIQTLDGGHEINEVFFDNVRAPLDNLVGEENKGWSYAKFLLGNERNGIARVGISKARIRRIRELASLHVYGERPRIEDPLFRMKLAAVEVELKALEMTQLRVIAGERNREKGKPDPASSVLKIKGSEIQQATSELLIDVVGPYALPFEPEREDGERWNEPPVGPDWASTIAPTYFNLRKVSIYGGSNEIQRGIIAKAILGL
jgi:pimeloyl-CoA dehydrogenase large subunit